MSDRKRFLWVAMLLAVLPMAAEGAVIYRQSFGFEGVTPGTAAERADISYVGWKGLYQRTEPQSDVISATVASSYYAGIRNAKGKPVDLPNVNTPTASANDTYGAVALFRADGQSYQALFYADHYSIDLAEWEINSISWYSAASSASAANGLRAALRIDGNWYVSQVFTSPALASNTMANFSTSAGERVVEPDKVLWYTLSAEVGSYFTIGENAVSLPESGILNAFGVHAVTSSTNGHTVMFDGYTISATAIPEPGVTVLIGMGLVLGVARWRRVGRHDVSGVF